MGLPEFDGLGSVEGRQEGDVRPPEIPMNKPMVRPFVVSDEDLGFGRDFGGGRRPQADFGPMVESVEGY